MSVLSKLSARARVALAAVMAAAVALVLGIAAQPADAASGQGSKKPAGPSCSALERVLAVGTVDNKTLKQSQGNEVVTVRLTADKKTITIVPTSGIYVSSFVTTVTTSTFEPVLTVTNGGSTANPFLKGKALQFVLCGGLSTTEPPAGTLYNCVFTDPNFEGVPVEFTFNHSVDGTSAQPETQLVQGAQFWRFATSANTGQAIHATVTYTDPNGGFLVTQLDTTIQPETSDLCSPAA